MRGKKIWTKFRQKMRRRIGVRKSSFKVCSTTLTRTPKSPGKNECINYWFIKFYLSKFAGKKFSPENSQETHVEISLKKFRQFRKKFIFTWHKEPCFIPRAWWATVVQRPRFGYRVRSGNPFGWHASVGLAYLPLGQPGEKRILK